jgi:hypothetical protein
MMNTLCGVGDTLDAIIERPDPHCVAWACASASLWGMSPDHDLDEPVRLSDYVPVRVRLIGRKVLVDRELSLRATRTGTALAVRLSFKDGSFKEADLVDVNGLSNGETAIIKRMTI